jgi:hypothetical protein
MRKHDLWDSKRHRSNSKQECGVSKQDNQGLHVLARVREQPLRGLHKREVFYDTLSYEIVPVVFGLGAYDKWVPKSAYIDVRDFKTVKKLVQYLVYLSKNADAYNAYFKWRQHIVSIDHKYQVFCDMCIKLHLETVYGIEDKSFDVAKEWDVEKHCMIPKLKGDRFLSCDFAPAEKVNKLPKMDKF